MAKKSRILVSPTAFKGTLSPWQAASHIKNFILKEACPVEISPCPLADGGDGTFEVLMHAFKGRVMKSRVRGPLGRRITARWGVIKDRTAIIEMAQASGIARLRERNRILEATTYGTGELIKAALNKGCKKILIGVGGTATADGGAGALHALGLKYYDKNGQVLSAQPKDLMKLNHIDWRALDPRIKKTKIIILCDVTNPLLGPQGSARVFGPQKGATGRQVLFLEKFLGLWSHHAHRNTKKHPGAGAAGALAFGLSGFIGAQLVRGAEFVMNSVGWRPLARKSKWIITGEGRVDATSFSGKVVGEITRQRGRAKVLVVCGGNLLSKASLRKKGIFKLAQMGPVGLRHPKRQMKHALKEVFDFAKLCLP